MVLRVCHKREGRSSGFYCTIILFFCLVPSLIEKMERQEMNSVNQTFPIIVKTSLTLLMRIYHVWQVKMTRQVELIEHTVISQARSPIASKSSRLISLEKAGESSVLELSFIDFYQNSTTHRLLSLCAHKSHVITYSTNKRKVWSQIIRIRKKKCGRKSTEHQTYKRSSEGKLSTWG